MNLPHASIAAAEARPGARRRRPLSRVVARASAPYALLAPATAVVAAVLAYPLYLLVQLSFQRYGLTQIVLRKGEWIGAENYRRILEDRQFWVVLGRTVAFTFVNVALTLVLGTLIALMLAALGTAMRLLVTIGLVLVWATPPVVAVNIWAWMVDFEFGVLNWTLTELGIGDFQQRDWFASPWSGFAVITALVVWGAIPFVAITVYAGLTQLPRELVEAASIDGAGAFRVFRDVTLPLLKPIFVILASLSVIWDFQVFNQVWIMRNARPTDEYYLMSIYAFVESFKLSEYGYGAAIAVVMVLIMLTVTFFYIRQMVRMGEVR